MVKEINKNLVYYLSLIGFFAIFTTTISKNPVLSLYTKALGANDIIIGLIAAFSPMAGMIFSFPIGIISDRIGRKKLLIASALIFFIAPIMYIFVNSALWLIPIRFFHGIATAILGPIAAAIIAGAYSKSKGEKLGIYSSSTLIGRTMAPLVGGGVISFVTAMQLSGVDPLIPYKAVYVIASLFAVPVLVMALLLKLNGQKIALPKIKVSDFYGSIKYIWSEKRIMATAFVQMSTYFAFGALETYLPIYLDSLGIPAYITGLIFSAQILTIALSQPLFGRLADRIDKRIQIVLGILTLGTALGITGLFTNIYIISGLGIVFGLGLSFSTIATSAYVADIAKKSRLGTSLGALSAIMDIGHTTGPFITGLMITTFSMRFGFISSLILASLSAIIFYIATRNK